jgi:hypothetical protein
MSRSAVGPPGTRLRWQSGVSQTFSGLATYRGKTDVVISDEAHPSDSNGHSLTPNGTPLIPSSDSTAVESHDLDDPNDISSGNPFKRAEIAPVKKAIWTPEMKDIFGQLMENLQEICSFVEKLECVI